MRPLLARRQRNCGRELSRAELVERVNRLPVLWLLEDVARVGDCRIGFVVSALRLQVQ